MALQAMGLLLQRLRCIAVSLIVALFLSGIANTADATPTRSPGRRLLQSEEGYGWWWPYPPGWPWYSTPRPSSRGSPLSPPTRTGPCPTPHSPAPPNYVPWPTPPTGPPQGPYEPPPSSNPGQPSNVQSQYLSGQNQARAAIGVPPLSWDGTVAAQAQQWANSLGQSQNCQMQHGDLSSYGQNLAWSSGSLSPAAAVSMWVAEGKQYTYAVFPNGCSTGNWGDCGHYTQVVWRATTSIGCGSYTCSSGATIVVCDYSPAGNVEGEYPY